jgi:hypothetical protein
VVRPPLVLLAALALALASPADAQPSGGSSPGSGLAIGASLGAGGETGMASGRSGLLELELAGGWEHEPTRLRPELAVALGFAPESSLAIRPGLRAGLTDVPVWLRAALDFSTSRRRGIHARWALFGGAWELRLNSLLALDLGLDFGIPMSQTAGVPVMLRFGATFRP